MKKVLYIVTILLGCVLLIDNVEAQIVRGNFQSTVNEEIDYFSNASNFKSTEVFEAYQKYVSLMQNADLSNYSESDNKVNIYMFRGDSCWHCLDEISWLASKTAEYGQYFNVITYEVWKNSDNNKLMSTVAKYLGKTADGVPFTIIGKQTYSGFSESTGEEMLKQVQELYNSNERYDIKDYIDLENGTIKNGETKQEKSPVVTIVLIAIILIVGIGLIYFVSKSK